jgi:DNA (cytosine-5)-methyltransferase 1
LGVNGLGIANEAPGPDLPVGQMPKLTLRMVARLQGFPDDWQFAGRKTSAYRQVGNAFPPPIARALGTSIMDALDLVALASASANLAHHASFIRPDRPNHTSIGMVASCLRMT